MTVQNTAGNLPRVPARDVDIHSTTVVPMRLRRISWGAIIAGIAIALVVMFALNMLGLSLGAATVNPMTEADPVEPALGTGVVIWYAASTLIALFLGGYVAGRMSGANDDTDGILHGLVVWAVVSLLTIFMLTTSIGNILNGVVSAASQALSSAGQVVSDVSPEVADALNLQTSAIASIQNEASILVRNAETNAATVGTDATNGAATATTDNQNVPEAMTLSQIEVNRAVSQLLTSGEIQDADRQDVINLLAERTNLTQEEAAQTVNRWEQAFTQIRNDAEETARQVSQQLADTVTILAGAVFALMIVGAFAAGAGGAVGVPDFERDHVDMAP
ncbi:MAG: YrzE family protein [Anaerolineae bacterium]|nr:YrzE family protein [Anaerolineae bacterium]